jgi:hypothetical protein
MIVCQWHLDVLYGKQAEAVKIMRAWGAEKFASSDFRLGAGIPPFGRPRRCFGLASRR